MERSRGWFSAATTCALALGVLGGGCSLVVDVGGYHAREDGEIPDADGGVGAPDADVDGGLEPSDGGVGRDGGRDVDASTACSPACDAGETCVDGACRCGTGAACTGSSVCCDGSCVTLGTTTACLACDDACEPAAHASATCEATGCGLECDAGFASCDDASPDCEQSLVSHEHCGSCGHACGATELCALSAGSPRCVSSCAFGQTACGGACVDLMTDPLHCGSCTMACPEPTGSTARCTGGTCGLTCDPGYGMCGGACVLLATFYEDADGDGYGGMGAATRQACPGSPPAGFVSSHDDCDDTRANVHPLATETCDSVDENCDGVVDDGFLCTAGDTRACTISVGSCSAAGTQGCSACNWGACTAPDLCSNRTDDDCDGLVDEGSFRVGTASPITPLPGYRFSEVLSAYNPSRREVGILTRGFDGTTQTISFARLNADTGARIGSVVTVATGFASYAIAYDGLHYTVVLSRYPGVEVYRIDATTSVSTLVATLDPTANAVTVARLGTSGSNVVVSWTTSMGITRLARLTMPATASAAPTPIGSTTSPLGSTVAHNAQAVTTGGGALLFYSVPIGGMGPYELRVGPVTSTSIGTFTPHLSGTVSSVFAVWEPTSNVVVAALTLYIGGVSHSAVRTFNTAGTTVSAETMLSGENAVSIGYAGEPGQVGVFSGRYYPATGNLDRVRASDRTVLGSPPTYVGQFNGMTALPDGVARYLVYQDDGVNLNAYPVLCL
ncbi:MAG: MopE-related protein [Sandaracinaceae bacterium]